MVAPVVSIVIPTFNRLAFLRATIASVYAQTVPDWELIVVDDGSNEETRRFLRHPPDSRMSVVLNAHTGVPAVTRNLGIARARGRYVAFLDSDDRWSTDKLRRQLALMEAAPARRWSYTAVRRIDGAGRVLEDSRVPFVPYSGSILEHVLRIDAQIATPTVMAELTFVRELGGFDEQMRFIEDYDLWARMALHSEAGVDPTPSADVRNHPEQFTWDRLGRLSGWASFYAKMERFVPSSHLRALCRRRKREHVLLVAAELARRRDWAGLRRTLAAAARARAFSPRGWMRVAKAAALAGSRGMLRRPLDRP